MKVKQLKLLLEKCNNEDEVVLSIDEEGNGFSPLLDVERGMTYSPVYRTTAIRELSEDDIKQGFSEEDVSANPDDLPCIILYPA
jgi:hypothetical protein